MSIARSCGRSANGNRLTVRLSVIVTTYQAPEWLEKVLWGYLAQSHRDFALLIADDGSTEETARLLARYSDEGPSDSPHLAERRWFPQVPHPQQGDRGGRGGLPGVFGRGPDSEG